MTSLGALLSCSGSCSLWLSAAVPRAPSPLVAETETLDFDRPESWGMKYYASLALLTSMGAPEKRARRHGRRSASRAATCRR